MPRADIEPDHIGTLDRLRLIWLRAGRLEPGELDRAAAILQRAIDVKEPRGWDTSLVYDVVNLRTMAQKLGQYAAAEQHLARSDAIARAYDHKGVLAIMTCDRGDFVSACRRWSQAESRFTATGSQYLSLAQQTRADSGR